MPSVRTLSYALAVSVVLASVVLPGGRIAIGQQPNPADEEHLKKLDAGPKTIDVAKYPPEQQKAYKLFLAKCSTCHVVARGINTDMALPGEWERYIKRMMYKPNAGISSDEGKTLYRFLVYDGTVRKVDELKKRLSALPAAEQAPAIEKLKAINPSFTP